jgi:hypothetical protein
MSDTTRTGLAAEPGSANAATATGPKTAEGKARSSLNALKHGRYALKHPTVLAIEDSDLFRKLYRDNLAHFSPASPVEARIVQQLTHVEWSIVRLQAIETAFLNRIYEAQATPAFGQPQAVDSPTRLGIALESSVNSSRFPDYVAKRLSTLDIDRARLLRNLRSVQNFSNRPEKIFSAELPVDDAQLTDSIED